MTILCTLIFILCVFNVPRFNENSVVFLISGVALYLMPLKVDWYFAGMGDFGYIALRSVIIKVISIFCLFGFVHDKQDLPIYVCISALSMMANEVWNFTKLLRLGLAPQIRFNRFLFHLKPIIILFSSFIATSIYTSLGTAILGFVDSYDEVAYYNLGSQMGNITVPLVTSLALVAMPRISHYIRQGNILQINELVSKSLSVTCFIAFPLSIGMCMISSTFVPLFYGDGYEGVIIPMQILSFVMISIGLNNITGIQILIGLGEDRLFLRSVLSCAAITSILYYLFILWLGAIGAAIVTLFAETFIFIVSSYYIISKTNVTLKPTQDMLKSFLGSATFIPIFLILKDFTQGWMLILTYVGLCIIVYVISQILLRNRMLIVLIKSFSSKIGVRI